MMSPLSSTYMSNALSISLSTSSSTYMSTSSSTTSVTMFRPPCIPHHPINDIAPRVRQNLLDIEKMPLTMSTHLPPQHVEPTEIIQFGANFPTLGQNESPSN